MANGLILSNSNAGFSHNLLGSASGWGLQGMLQGATYSGSDISGLHYAGSTAASAGSALGSSGSGGFDIGVGGGISLGSAIGQAVGGMYSAWKGAKTNKYVAQAQADIAKNNQTIAQMGAESAFRAGQAEIAKLTLAAGKKKASQRAAYAANGVALGVGSSAEQTASTDIIKEVDKDTAQMNALASAWGYRRQQTQYYIDEQTARARADAYGDYAYLAAGATLLSGASSVASKWQQLGGSATAGGSSNG